MNLYIKRSLILASLFSAFQLYFSPKATAQTEPTPETTEEVVAATDSLQEEMADTAYGDNYVPYVSGELIEDRLGCLQNEINLEYNRTIQGFIEFFVVRKRDYTRMVLGRTDLYFPIFEEYLKKYNLPAELKYLSVVESGLNPRIISRAKAGGLWQFMPGTGRDFRLYQDAFIDERFDPYKSTEAACKYLKQLYNLFGDWELALASYNCGPGNVRRAIRRSGNRTGFWEIYNYLPRETRSYVPQFVALAYVLNYAEDYRLKADTMLHHIPFDTIQVSQHVNMEQLAKQLNTPLPALQQLNPHIKKNIIPPYIKNYPIRIPADRRDFFEVNRMAILDSVSKADPAEMRILLASNAADNVHYQKKKIFHVVRRGESLAGIADRYNVGTSQVKGWNHLRSTKVRKGQRLVIWMRKPITTHQPLPGSENTTAVAKTTPAARPEVDTTTTEHTSEQRVAKSEAAPARKKVVHVVRRGEALSRIADKYHVGMDDIQEWNHMRSKTVRSGQRLTVWIEQPTVAKSVKARPDSNSLKAQEAVAGVREEQKAVDNEKNAAEETTTTDQAVSQPKEIEHTVQKGEGLFKIAKAYGVEVAKIKEWNNLKGNSVRVGQHLKIMTEGAEAASEQVTASTDNGAEAVVPKSSKTASARKETRNEKTASAEKSTSSKTSEPKYHRVQKGDTLWSISKQYGNIPVEKLKKLNKLKSNELKAGQKLIVG